MLLELGAAAALPNVDPLPAMIHASVVLLPLPDMVQFMIELLPAPSVAPALAIQKTVAVAAALVFVTVSELPPVFNPSNFT